MRQVTDPFISNKLQNTTVCHSVWVFIGQFKQHRVCDIKSACSKTENNGESHMINKWYVSWLVQISILYRDFCYLITDYLMCCFIKLYKQTEWLNSVSVLTKAASKPQISLTLRGILGRSKCSSTRTIFVYARVLCVVDWWTICWKRHHVCISPTNRWKHTHQSQVSVTFRKKHLTSVLT